MRWREIISEDLSPQDAARFAPYKLSDEDRDFYIRLAGGVEQALEQIEKERRKGLLYRAEDRAIHKVIALVPSLVNASRPVSYQVACAIIAYDVDLFSMVVGWTENADHAEDHPEVAARFLSVLKRIQPPVKKHLFRGQQAFGEHEANKRGFHSWSENRATAEMFAERTGKVLEINRPIQGVALSDIITWRMRMTNESHYPGPQAEWFVVDQPEQYER